MVGASKPTKVIQEPCLIKLMSLSLPPGTRNGLGVKSSRRPRLLSPYSAFSAVSLAPVTRSRLPPAPQVGVACSLWRRPVPWTRVQCCHGMAAGEGKGTQPDRPANGRPPQRQGEGSPARPEQREIKAKARGKSKTKASRTPPAHAKTRRRKKPIGEWPEPDGKLGTCGEAERLPCRAGKEPPNT